MLAMDRVEADGIVESFLKEKSLAAVYEEVLIPALSYAKEDRARGRLGAEKGKFLFENVRELVEELEQEEERPSEDETEHPRVESVKAKAGPESVVVVPARDEADEIAGEMLAQLLRRRGIGARSLSASALSGESLAELAGGVKVVCISSAPPTELRRARYLWKKVRALKQELKLVGGVWGATQNLEEIRVALADFKPDAVVTSLAEAVAVVVSLSATNAAAPVRKAA
jgi:hypothetical protein